MLKVFVRAFAECSLKGMVGEEGLEPPRFCNTVKMAKMLGF
jgi:hypothetical protein